MKRTESLDQWSARLDARAERHETTPHYVYRAFDSVGILLYIGCTINVKSRMSSHRTNSAWVPYADTIGVTEYPSRSEARAAEALAIETEGAAFNSTRTDIARTQANRNAARRALWARGDFAPAMPDMENWDAEYDAYAELSDGWDRRCWEMRKRLKATTHPYLTEAERLASYRAMRADSLRAAS